MSKVAPLLLKGNATPAQIISVVAEILTDENVKEVAMYIQQSAESTSQKIYVGAGQIVSDSKDVYLYATSQTEYLFKKKVTEITKNDIENLLKFLFNATNTTSEPTE